MLNVRRLSPSWLTTKGLINLGNPVYQRNWVSNHNLIKNQVEQSLTNSWVALIRDSFYTIIDVSPKLKPVMYGNKLG